AIGADGQRPSPHAQHLGHARPVEIGVEDADPPAVEREGVCQIRRERRLADAAFAGDHGHDGPHAAQPLAQPRLLRLHLADDVRPAVTGHVRVALRHSYSAAFWSVLHAATATNSAATMVTTKNTAAPARNVISPPHGAATVAVSGRSTTRSTAHARMPMKSVRMRAKSRRPSTHRSNHTRRRQRRYGMPTTNTSPSTIHSMP